jgi:hypothetical protein
MSIRFVSIAVENLVDGDILFGGGVVSDVRVLATSVEYKVTEKNGRSHICACRKGSKVAAV